MIITSSMQAAIDSGDFKRHWFFWVEAKHRTTGASEAAGVYTGLDDFTVTINGQVRTYVGVGMGEMLDVPEIITKQGLNNDKHDVSLAILSPHIANMLQAYNADLQPADIYLGIWAKDGSFAGMSPAAQGFLDGITIGRGENARAEVELTSTNKNAIRGLTVKKSHQSQKAMYPDDDGFLYASVAGTTDINWGVGEGRKYSQLTGGMSGSGINRRVLGG